MSTVPMSIPVEPDVLRGEPRRTLSAGSISSNRDKDMALETGEALFESSWQPAGTQRLLNKLAWAFAEMGEMGLDLLDEPNSRNPSNIIPH